MVHTDVVRPQDTAVEDLSVQNTAEGESMKLQGGTMQDDTGMYCTKAKRQSTGQGFHVQRGGI